MKRKTRITLIFAAVFIALVLVIALGTDIRKPEEYYSTSGSSEPEGDFEVTMSVDCSVVLQNMDLLPAGLKESGTIPENGIMLQETIFSANEGDSVFDILLKATQQFRIQMEYTGDPDAGISAVYIKSIGHLYEFSCGPLSGWMFRVNKEFPGDDSSGYILQPGDRVEWMFTCDLGRDIGNDYGGAS